MLTPDFSACDRSRKILCEMAIAVEPRYRALDYPTARQKLEALGRVGSLDKFERPASDSPQRFFQLVSGVAAIGENVTRPWKGASDQSEERRCAVAILDVGLVHNAGNR